MLESTHGWRAVFFTTGVGGMVWGLVWWLVLSQPARIPRQCGRGRTDPKQAAALVDLGADSKQKRTLQLGRCRHRVQVSQAVGRLSRPVRRHLLPVVLPDLVSHLSDQFRHLSVSRPRSMWRCPSWRPLSGRNWFRALSPTASCAAAAAWALARKTPDHLWACCCGQHHGRQLSWMRRRR